MPPPLDDDAAFPATIVESFAARAAAARTMGAVNAPWDASPGLVQEAVGQRHATWASRGDVVGAGLGLAAVIAVVAGGFLTDSQATLQIMGFDPDRAGLIMSLVGGAIAAAVAAVAGARTGIAVPLGTATVLLMFFPVFRSETEAAVNSQGADGTFYALGWALSAFAVLGAAIVVGWAAALMGTDVRRRATWIFSAARAVWSEPAGRGRDALRIWFAVVATLGFAAALPVFGDMMNFQPDVHMRQGAPAGVPLFGTDTAGGGGSGGTRGGDASASPVASSASPVASRASPVASSAAAHASTSSDLSPSTGPLDHPPALVAGPIPGSFVTAGALATATPWAAHPPVGAGRTISFALPAPWIGGIRDKATVDVYLPPGYDTGTGRYPVIYEAPQPLSDWEKAVHITSLLDTIITSGQIPPVIVVFASQFGGPYPDSQCADSWDGKEWFDRYLATDVPTWVDSHFRTIATPAARAVLGFSVGGYCAAAAVTHHPDVFGSAASFSGYFESGITTSTTPSAGRPFNNDPSLEARVSPIVVAPRLSEADRNRIFFVLSADPANRFYANQITVFAAVLNAASIPHAILPAPQGHSWAAVREQLPDMLGFIASRQVRLGVFDSP